MACVGRLIVRYRLQGSVNQDSFFIFFPMDDAAARANYCLVRGAELMNGTQRRLMTSGAPEGFTVDRPFALVVERRHILLEIGMLVWFHQVQAMMSEITVPIVIGR
jgi:hypothetical protein